MKAAQIDPIKASMIRTMMLQTGNLSAANIIATSYMVATAWFFTSRFVILGWAVANLSSLVARRIVIRAFVRSQPPDEELAPWARWYTLSALLSGVMWALSFLLFAHPEKPITVTLTLSCLYAVAAGSTLAGAYHPQSILMLIIPPLVAMLGKLALTGEFEYILLALVSVLYGVVMIGFCRVQSREVEESFRIRFENDELVRQLARERAEADEARKAAEEANLAKSQFLAAASHDLRQPLYALSLFSSSLDTLKLDHDGQGVVRRIQDSIQAMEGSFEGLLDLSKLEAGVITPRLEPVLIDDLFDRVSQVFRPLALERGLDLRLRSDGEVVMSDAALAEQVIGNLVSNAIRYTEAGGVLIAARRRGAALRIEVRDTGRGIAEEDLQRIFGDYVQLANPQRDRQRGLGLGLAIAQRAVALLGSKIEVTSRPGRGSCFAFGLPLATGEHRVAAPVASPAAIARDPGLPLLVIEDDENVRAALVDLLGRWGLAFEDFGTAEDALARVAAGGRFGLVLTDQRLPGEMSGLDFVRRLRRDLADAPPAIIITGEVDSPLLRAAADDGVVILHKPLQAARLRALLGVSGA